MKKKIARSIFIILLMLPMIAVAHFFVFPQETRCILISFADFDKQQNIYSRENTEAGKINKLVALQSLAEKRNKTFWGDNSLLDYRIIFCNTEKDFNNYGIKGAPAATQLKMGAYVVLQDVSVDADIIAHEISHTILYRNIGWYKTVYKIPTWFSEGLAMQVDNRPYYSIDSLIEKQRAGLKLPDVKKMGKPGDFFAGTNEMVMLNFSTAKYTVHEWLKTHSLQKFLKAIKDNEGFEKAYKE